MQRSSSIIKDSTKYTLGTIAAQVIGIFTSIATRRLLTPEMMGVWATFLLVLNYSLFAHMGIFTAVEVRIPYLRGKNETGEIEAIRDIAYTFGMAVSLIMAAALVIVSFLFAREAPSYIILGIRMTALIVAATLFYNLYIVMLRADKKFSLIAKAMVFNSAAMFLFITVLAYLYGLKGVYFATFLATTASWLYVRSKAGYKLKPRFKVSKAVGLTKIGLPILIVGIAYTFLISIDKIMIIKMMGAKELGFYSIAVLALTYTNTFPKLFGIVIFPNMQEAFGRTDSKEHIMGYVRQPALILAYIFPALLAAAYFALPVLVHYVLPKYILGIGSMKMLLVGCFFISLAPLAQNFVISLNKQVVLIPMTIAAVFLGMGLNYGAIKMGYGINGVACGTSVAYFVYFVAVFYYALIHCDKWQKICGFFLRVCAPLVYAAAVLVALECLVKNPSLCWRTLIQAGVFFLAYLPVLLYLDRKTGISARFFKREPAGVMPVENELIIESTGQTDVGNI
ncbi:MAG: oligosaccharide flippase family protein [Candidatus Omnitrophota bacterium]